MADEPRLRRPFTGQGLPAAPVLQRQLYTAVCYCGKCSCKVEAVAIVLYLGAVTIKLEDLVVGYRGPQGTTLPILRIPAWELPPQQAVCVTGPSGSGKTTFLNVLAGILLPQAGRVLYGDVDITSLAEPQRDVFRARHIGYVFQSFHLLPALTAIENVALSLSLAGHGVQEARARAFALLERVALAHRANAYPSTLSVGEQQRVSIARAVANHPKVILADEPTANLDIHTSDGVLALLTDVSAECGSNLILVTHEERVMAHFSQTISMADICVSDASQTEVSSGTSTGAKGGLGAFL